MDEKRQQALASMWLQIKQSLHVLNKMEPFPLIYIYMDESIYIYAPLPL